MDYLKGINYWQCSDFSRTRLTPVPVAMPSNMQVLGNGFLGGNAMNSFGFHAPITHLQTMMLNNLNLNSQGGISVGSQQIIVPAYNNINTSE
jgi:hypothetical protein